MLGFLTYPFLVIGASTTPHGVLHEVAAQPVRRVTLHFGVRLRIHFRMARIMDPLTHRIQPELLITALNCGGASTKRMRPCRRSSSSVPTRRVKSHSGMEYMLM